MGTHLRVFLCRTQWGYSPCASVHYSWVVQIGMCTLTHSLTHTKSHTCVEILCTYAQCNSPLVFCASWNIGSLLLLSGTIGLFVSYSHKQQLFGDLHRCLSQMCLGMNTGLFQCTCHWTTTLACSVEELVGNMTRSGMLLYRLHGFSISCPCAWILLRFRYNAFQGDNSEIPSVSYILLGNFLFKKIK